MIKAMRLNLTNMQGMVKAFFDLSEGKKKKSCPYSNEPVTCKYKGKMKMYPSKCVAEMKGAKCSNASKKNDSNILFFTAQVKSLPIYSPRRSS